MRAMFSLIFYVMITLTLQRAPVAVKPASKNKELNYCILNIYVYLGPFTVVYRLSVCMYVHVTSSSRTRN
jgi:hypothetical protein